MIIKNKQELSHQNVKYSNSKNKKSKNVSELDRNYLEIANIGTSFLDESKYFRGRIRFIMPKNNIWIWATTTRRRDTQVLLMLREETLPLKPPEVHINSRTAKPSPEASLGMPVADVVLRALNYHITNLTELNLAPSLPSLF